MARSDFIKCGKLVPAQDTRASRQLSAGGLVITVTSRNSGQHLTLEFKSRLDTKGFPKWKRVPFAEASHVFISTPGGDRVGTFYPKSEKFYPGRGADPARVKTAIHVLGTLCGKTAPFRVYNRGQEMDAYEQIETNWFTMVSSNACGKCGRELTDPVSVSRGLGPTCYGASTGSEHQTKQPFRDPLVGAEAHASRAREAAEALQPATDGKGRALPHNFNELASRI